MLANKKRRLPHWLYWLLYCLSCGRQRYHIDETWTKTNMAPLRGWARRGERLPGKAPFGHWNTMTFLAALRRDRIEAPWLLDGPINGERFLIYVEQVLLPTLAKGDLVVMDNLGSHKAKAVQMTHHYLGGIEGIKQAAWSAPDIGCNMIASTLGADLIMYGPIENVEAMITAQAYTDIVVLEAMRPLGIDVKAENHPIFKLI